MNNNLAALSKKEQDLIKSTANMLHNINITASGVSLNINASSHQNKVYEIGPKEIKKLNSLMEEYPENELAKGLKNDMASINKLRKSIGLHPRSTDNSAIVRFFIANKKIGKSWNGDEQNLKIFMKKVQDSFKHFRGGSRWNKINIKEADDKTLTNPINWEMAASFIVDKPRNKTADFAIDMGWITRSRSGLNTVVKLTDNAPDSFKEAFIFQLARSVGVENPESIRQIAILAVHHPQVKEKLEKHGVTGDKYFIDKIGNRLTARFILDNPDGQTAAYAENKGWIKRSNRLFRQTKVSLTNNAPPELQEAFMLELAQSVGIENPESAAYVAIIADCGSNLEHLEKQTLKKLQNLKQKLDKYGISETTHFKQIKKAEFAKLGKEVFSNPNKLARVRTLKWISNPGLTINNKKAPKEFKESFNKMLTAGLDHKQIETNPKGFRQFIDFLFTNQLVTQNGLPRKTYSNCQAWLKYRGELGDIMRKATTDHRYYTFAENQEWIKNGMINPKYKNRMPKDIQQQYQSDVEYISSLFSTKAEDLKNDAFKQKCDRAIELKWLDPQTYRATPSAPNEFKKAEEERLEKFGKSWKTAQTAEEYQNIPQEVSNKYQDDLTFAQEMGWMNENNELDKNINIHPENNDMTKAKFIKSCLETPITEHDKFNYDVYQSHQNAPHKTLDKLNHAKFTTKPNIVIIPNGADVPPQISSLKNSSDRDEQNEYINQTVNMLTGKDPQPNTIYVEIDPYNENEKNVVKYYYPGFKNDEMHCNKCQVSETVFTKLKEIDANTYTSKTATVENSELTESIKTQIAERGEKLAYNLYKENSTGMASVAAQAFDKGWFDINQDNNQVIININKVDKFLLGRKYINKCDFMQGLENLAASINKQFLTDLSQLDQQQIEHPAQQIDDKNNQIQKEIEELNINKADDNDINIAPAIEQNNLNLTDEPNIVMLPSGANLSLDIFLLQNSSQPNEQNRYISEAVKQLTKDELQDNTIYVQINPDDKQNAVRYYYPDGTMKCKTCHVSDKQFNNLKEIDKKMRSEQVETINDATLTNWIKIHKDLPANDLQYNQLQKQDHSQRIRSASYTAYNNKDQNVIFRHNSISCAEQANMNYNNDENDKSLVANGHH